MCSPDRTGSGSADGHVVSVRMSTTSQKHRNFVSEPMADKPVTALAGIGDRLGHSLMEQGYDKVEPDRTAGPLQPPGGAAAPTGSAQEPFT